MAVNRITTGQYVNLQQTAASASDRIFGQLIDIFILTAYSIGIMMIVSFNDDVIRSILGYEYPMYFVFCVVVLPIVFYHPLMEIFCGGRSVGKMIMHTRVVMQDGSTPGIGAYLLRWILLPIDLFILNGLGLVFILFSERSQRLGDMVAGTMVIKVDSARRATADLSSFHFVEQGYQPTYPQAADLSMRQAEVISNTLYLKGGNRDVLLARLAGKVTEMFDISPVPAGPASEQLLRTVMADYHYYAATLDS